jgi:Zn-dependent protease with chaperone function
MASRHLVTRTIIWVYVIVDVAMVTLGVVFVAALWTNSASLLSFVEPPALFLASWLFTLFLLQLFIMIIARMVQVRILLRRPVSDELKERLQKLGVETLTRMRIDRSIGLSVAKKSSSAFAYKNRIHVGEQLLQTAPDDEIIGTIAHEMGHLLTKHFFLVKKLIFSLRVIAFLIVLYLTAQSDAELILGVTGLVTFTLARIPLNWKLEYKADREAATRLGADPIVVSLEKMKETYYDGVSFTHPPLSKRIQRIQASFMASLTSPVAA